jgi:hypothetical protein
MEYILSYKQMREVYNPVRCGRTLSLFCRVCTPNSSEMKGNPTTVSSYWKSPCFFLPSPSVFDPISLAALPPTDDLQILLNRIELQLPKDDHVKYDSRQVILATCPSHRLTKYIRKSPPLPRGDREMGS